MSGYDVFLSHNSSDKPTVRAIKKALARYGLVSWLDEDELQPGVPWQKLLEAAIHCSRSVAVCIANDGLGPWEDEEVQATLRLAVKDRRPVIPVLLPGAPARVDLPMFLCGRTWVDLRGGLDDAGIRRLVWGITGQRPQQAAPPAGRVSTSRSLQRKDQPHGYGDNFAEGEEEKCDNPSGLQAGAGGLKVSAAIERELMNYLGPMARFLVKKHACKARDIRDLCQRLGAHIPETEDRKRFIASCESWDAGPETDGSVIRDQSPVSNNPERLDPGELAKVERILTIHIGPMAKVLVKAQAKSAISRDDLYMRLAQQIPGAKQRREFLDQLNRTE